MRSEYPLLHGEAIAIGMICESYIAHDKGLLPQTDLDDIVQTITDLYDLHPEAVMDVSRIIEYSMYDKKNKGGKIRCTLIENIGSALINQEISAAEIERALVYYGSL